jgi:hypothetical protein
VETIGDLTKLIPNTCISNALSGLGQSLYVAPYSARRGVVGHYIDRCILIAFLHKQIAKVQTVGQERIINSAYRAWGEGRGKVKYIVRTYNVL